MSPQKKSLRRIKGRSRPAERSVAPMHKHGEARGIDRQMRDSARKAAIRRWSGTATPKRRKK